MTLNGYTTSPLSQGMFVLIVHCFTQLGSSRSGGRGTRLLRRGSDDWFSWAVGTLSDDSLSSEEFPA